FIAHSRGWSHEDMENNVAIVQNSKGLAEGACMLAKRLLDLAGRLIAAGRSARFDRAWRPQSQSGVDGITDKPCVARRRGVVNVGKAQILNPDHVRGSGICKRKLYSRPLRSKPPRKKSMTF